MSSTTPRRLLVTLTAATLALSACGGSDEEVVEPAAAPTPSAAASAETAPELECPLTATEVAAPEDATTDLTTKPVVTGSDTPPPTELQYADLVVGDGAEAVTGSQVEVKYVGAFYESGEEFDSSWSRGDDETLPFGICQDGVIPGFAVGPTGMLEGGRRQITIPSELAYGAAGQGPIPPDSALVFVVDMVSVS